MSTSTIGKKALTLAAGLLAAGALTAGDAIDSALAGYLGKEITIDAPSANAQLPKGNKLTLVHDAASDAVRVCTSATEGCTVSLNFTRGERYCSVEDVKAGDGEVLASCHRLRGGENMIVFLLSPDSGKNAIAILVDSPSRVTDEPIIIGKF